MVKLLSACAALLPLSAAVAPAPAPIPFVVKGYLPGTKAHKAYLTYQHGLTLVVDSVSIIKGRFQLSGLVDTPQQASLRLPPPGTSYTHMLANDITTIYLEKGTITLTGTSEPMDIFATGTPLNNENATLAAQAAPIKKKIAALNLMPHKAAADTALVRQTDAQINQLEAQQNAVYATYIRTHPASPFSLFALGIFGGYQPDVATYAPLFQTLAPSLRNSAEGQKIQQQIARLQRTAIGSLAPDFSLPDPNGKLVKLSELRGQYVLVDFWASWCVPCRAENPNVAKAYAAYRGKNFTVVSISVDKQANRVEWLKAIEQDGLNWPQVLVPQDYKSEVVKEYAINAIPQNFLLDPQGRIIAKNLRGAALPQKLSQVFAAN